MRVRQETHWWRKTHFRKERNSLGGMYTFAGLNTLIGEKILAERGEKNWSK